MHARSQTHLSLQQRRLGETEELKQPTENRLWTYCFAKRKMYALLNVVIGFDYCNHWNLKFRLAKRRLQLVAR